MFLRNSALDLNRGGAIDRCLGFLSSDLFFFRTFRTGALHRHHTRTIDIVHFGGAHHGHFAFLALLFFLFFFFLRTFGAFGLNQRRLYAGQHRGCRGLFYLDRRGGNRRHFALNLHR
ncbi:MAG: hypothetical protein L6Q97_08370 [Thermoanaerobaculia bacterium]|nr:hypothetical protein [Thermoanaerobaculia bacterium]